jgi:hypothetical protein
MDEEEFEALRRWASALSSDGRPELRAAAKAITLLADEVERLRIAIWTLTLEGNDARARALEAANLETTLQGRVRSSLQRVAKVVDRRPQ